MSRVIVMLSGMSSLDRYVACFTKKPDNKLEEDGDLCGV